LWKISTFRGETVEESQNMNTDTAKSSGHRLGLTLSFALGLTLSAPALFGTTCGTATLSTYDAAGYVCTLGEYNLYDFTFSSSETGGAELLSDSQITVNPTGSTPTAISVQFSPTIPDGFSVSSGQTAEYVIQYQLDPVFPTIKGATVDLGPNDPVSLTGQFCGNGTINSGLGLPTSCTGTNTAGIFPFTQDLPGTGTAASATFAFSQLVSSLDTRLILDLDGPAEVDSFGSVANVTEGGPSAVPEPSTSLLLAPGLLAFVWLRKKWQAR
jgi:hypothetical protein